MNQMSNYQYANLSEAQKAILQKAEDDVNLNGEAPILLMAFDAKNDGGSAK